VGYFDWHEQPGYFRDVTRHLAPDSELLDVGCGAGCRLADHFLSYTGIDGPPGRALLPIRRRNVRLVARR